ncbi:DUF5710 domain-containing protein [Thomasclavelia sp.]|uniref:DUF5710 domain-containing protein n=1 Tax=Thomasclavelia sp. TaxID=3025757 RepID=UPI00261B0296|nr:DUF5710 domain-containing protein [Thomasclavelia sp.]
MLILNVPYSEKDDAKSSGAKWNPAIKKWYVENKENYYKFIRWIEPYGNMVIIDELYLIEGTKKCFRCGKDTRVIGFGIDKHLSIAKLLEIENDDEIKEILYDKMLEINQDDIHIVGPIDPIPETLMKYIQSKYNYKLRYSKTTHISSICNCCDNCDVLQGDFFLFDEVDSPFFIHSQEDVKKLKIYKIKLEQDLIVNAKDGWASFDEMFKKYGNIMPLEIKI